MVVGDQLKHAQALVITLSVTEIHQPASATRFWRSAMNAASLQTLNHGQCHGNLE